MFQFQYTNFDDFNEMSEREIKKNCSIKNSTSFVVTIGSHLKFYLMIKYIVMLICGKFLKW